MQVIKDNNWLLKPADSDIPEMESVFCRLTFVHGHEIALEKFYEYFCLRWSKTLIKSWKKKFEIISENNESEDWLVKITSNDLHEKQYIAWKNKNFIAACKRTSIPAKEILESIGEEAFTPFR